MLKKVEKKKSFEIFVLVAKAELNDTGKYTCRDRQSGETTECDVEVEKATIRLIKGFPETLTIPQGKRKFNKLFSSTSVTNIDVIVLMIENDIREFFSMLNKRNLLNNSNRDLRHFSKIKK